MRFSIVMPSYLGKYRNSASNLEVKIKRAIDSVLKQTFEDWELIVVADGCLKTMEIVTPLVYDNLPKIRMLTVPKQQQWSGTVRNAGIFKAEGEIIIYLDVDDFWGVNHLNIVNDNFGDNDWVFFDDWVWDKKYKEWVADCATFKMGCCGTSNIAHKKSMEAYWTSNTYLHDFVFIQNLIGLSKNYSMIPAGEYYVCHKPNNYDI